MNNTKKTVPFKFDEAMCGVGLSLDQLRAVAKYLTEKGFPSEAVLDSFNGAPSEDEQEADGAVIPEQLLFCEAVTYAESLI